MAEPTASDGAGRRCAVVGHPVAHSLSPVMHRAAYEALGLDWRFDAVDVDPGGLPAFVAGRDATWRGLAVTAPHKRDALELADHASDVALAAGGANTLLLEHGPASLTVHADNTDVPGAAAALRERGIHDLGLVRVLGAGATAASVAHAVAGLGATGVELVVRDAGRAAATVEAIERVGLRVRLQDASATPSDMADLLVSTVPEDVAGRDADRWVASAAAVFDVVYDPWPTRLLEAARGAGLPTVSGLDLLAHQAAVQLALMTGSPVDVAPLRDAALRAVAGHAGGAADLA